MNDRGHFVMCATLQSARECKAEDSNHYGVVSIVSNGQYAIPRRVSLVLLTSK